MNLSLKALLNSKKLLAQNGNEYKEEIQKLQLDMLRIQQGIWHRKDRAIIMFEGFDAAGKGGAIRKMTEMLDPRGFKVHPIGAPTKEEQSKHWLYRFWVNLPSPGTIAIFDRSWYGRVLVERVNKLIDKEQWEMAYQEINQFEATLKNDGVHIIKIFIAISKDEQYHRFEDRLNDPYKQWKISMDDIEARQKWDKYVLAVDEMFTKTNTKQCPWNLIPGDSKHFARKKVMEIVSHELKHCKDWMEKEVKNYPKKDLQKLLKKI